MNLSDVPEVLDAEVDPRLEAVIKTLGYALVESLDYEDAIDSALDLLIIAKGWLIVSKAMELA